MRLGTGLCHIAFNGHFTCGRYLFFRLTIPTQYGTVGEYSHPLTLCRGQVWPTYGARKSALQMFVLYSCFHLLLASWPSHSMLDLVFCLRELHGRNTGLQQLELAMQCISSPSQKISKRKEEIKLLADKNIFQICGPIKPKDYYVRVLDHFSFDTSVGTGL